MSNKLYQKYYTLGVYVDTWGLNEGAIPHVFLGLKIEYRLIADSFRGILNDEYNKVYVLETQLKSYNKTTQMEFIERLTHDINNDDNKNKWIKNTALFDNEFLFFTQGYQDITLHVKEYLKSKIFFHYQSYKQSLDKFIQSKTSNIRDIEGFFGFAPYKSSAPLRTSSYGKQEMGGKVYQNNHYEYIEAENKTNNILTTNNSGECLMEDNLKIYSFSNGHVLTRIRPISTFQANHAFAMEIPQEKYIEVASKIIEDVLITDDDLRGGFAFVDNDSKFRYYALIGRSCVTFVMDKLKIIFGKKLDWWDNITWTPQGVYNVIKKHSQYFNSIEYLIFSNLLDINLFYQNYATLCKLDSTWESEKGLRAFSEYYNSMLYSHLIYDEKLNRLGQNKIPSIPRDSNIEHIENDVNMRLNVGLCVKC
ncbi:hypothetical protein DCO58_05840 [Helicobacter saguini]|uniref:Uncharacterized protein n=1 Tax=Helicobacter saguini TaxID=1548018 RepID=A0A347VTE1_9HELI|nr:hypothetical protein [Helicobacter saguini]MWV62132.1 hypothetical protein [Helicobacter saguini]MWV67196.1 hypothetical protein [Helicobacter saguini]MWV69548.1 hypothetical protein [Helicobacter saguini]MWV70901.1 hypothetical protein [Helicobacter saguini]TLD91488.1 hypothetical protein LS64_011910 [Helicobacter saguini]